jgi:hypothetical protein
VECRKYLGESQGWGEMRGGLEWIVLSMGNQAILILPSVRVASYWYKSRNKKGGIIAGTLMTLMNSHDNTHESRAHLST